MNQAWFDGMLLHKMQAAQVAPNDILVFAMMVGALSAVAVSHAMLFAREHHFLARLRPQLWALAVLAPVLYFGLGALTVATMLGTLVVINAMLTYLTPAHISHPEKYDFTGVRSGRS